MDGNNVCIHNDPQLFVLGPWRVVFASDVVPSPLPHSYSFTAESDTPPQASGLSTIVGEEAVFLRTGLAWYAPTNSPLLPLFPEAQF